MIVAFVETITIASPCIGQFMQVKVGRESKTDWMEGEMSCGEVFLW